MAKLVLMPRIRSPAADVCCRFRHKSFLTLKGGGIYWLGDQWYPTQARDFIWMAHFYPQWFGAIGKQPAKCLILNDFNRHTLA